MAGDHHGQVVGRPDLRRGAHGRSRSGAGQIVLHPGPGRLADPAFAGQRPGHGGLGDTQRPGDLVDGYFFWLFLFCRHGSFSFSLCAHCAFFQSTSPGTPCQGPAAGPGPFSPLPPLFFCCLSAHFSLPFSLILCYNHRNQPLRPHRNETRSSMKPFLPQPWAASPPPLPAPSLDAGACIWGAAWFCAAFSRLAPSCPGDSRRGAFSFA